MHARKLLKFYGFTNDELITKVNKILNMLTFAVFRFGVFIFIYISLYLDCSRVSIAYMIFLLTCILLMSVINVVLFKRLLMTDYIRPRMKRKEAGEQQQDAVKNEESDLKLLASNGSQSAVAVVRES